ncbi:bifunctional DNA-formamidopyrimidine glycosylase/DNA-(apurinic or apyrimidinic site) lyase [Candidatus Pelagibacter sp.]|jgi:formamidopyrimidine-DNA glycosylase|nr:bifunctional DNA-formamidopyrimidine glycosylase/DNA-(apurinic or apyrimidinic site) lyase [Candidatus Pelagibacter sp.]
MPELPEVEIVRQSLDKKIQKKKVKKVIIRNRNLRIKIPYIFEKFLENKTIVKVSRFSKYLIIHLSDNQFCLIHLGMSGTIHLIDFENKKNFTNLSFYNSPFLPKKHNHIEIIFDKFRIIYNDPRRFGFFQIIKNTKDLKNRFIHLGPEPFNGKFNLKYFKNFIKNKTKTIKDLLIDQKFVSGIGNIYASEILFLSKVNPNKKIKLLSKKECNKIISSSKKVLLDAINKGGSSIRDFKNTDGSKGGFQDSFKVYQREGKNCKRVNCNGKILKKVITNRSTFFCNYCQN